MYLKVTGLANIKIYPVGDMMVQNSIFSKGRNGKMSQVGDVNMEYI